MVVGIVVIVVMMLVGMVMVVVVLVLMIVMVLMIKMGVKRRPSDKLRDEDQEPRATAWLPGMETRLSLC